MYTIYKQIIFNPKSQIYTLSVLFFVLIHICDMKHNTISQKTDIFIQKAINVLHIFKGVMSKCQTNFLFILVHSIYNKILKC